MLKIKCFAFCAAMLFGNLYLNAQGAATASINPFVDQGSCAFSIKLGATPTIYSPTSTNKYFKFLSSAKQKNYAGYANLDYAQSSVALSPLSVKENLHIKATVRIPKDSAARTLDEIVYTTRISTYYNTATASIAGAPAAIAQPSNSIPAAWDLVFTLDQADAGMLAIGQTGNATVAIKDLNGATVTVTPTTETALDKGVSFICTLPVNHIYEVVITIKPKVITTGELQTYDHLFNLFVSAH